MNRNVTLSVRSLLLSVVVALALLVAYLLGGAGSSGAPAQAADDEAAPAQPRHLTMTGTGDATAVPDELSFSVAVTQTRTDLGDAMDAATASMNRVLAAVAKHGVERSDVQTTGLSMTPVYAYHQDEPATIVGYRVTQRASVLVTALRDGGETVAAAVSAGGNAARVSGLRLLVGDPATATARARDAAVAEARAKAKQYADASGQALGDVMTISEVHVKPLPTPSLRLARGAVYDSAVTPMPIRAGTERTTVTVRIVWELA